MEYGESIAHQNQLNHAAKSKKAGRSLAPALFFRR
jgi:hypothetical protein